MVLRGIVKTWFDEKGFGFIGPDEGGPDIYVHSTGILGSGFKSLAEGEEVEYEIQDERGRKERAINVSGPGGRAVKGSSGGGGGGGRGGGGSRGGDRDRDRDRGDRFESRGSRDDIAPLDRHPDGCFSCGRLGHRAAECPNRRDRDGGREERRPDACFSCGRSGHRAVDCPNRDRPRERDRDLDIYGNRDGVRSVDRRDGDRSRDRHRDDSRDRDDDRRRDRYRPY